MFLSSLLLQGMGMGMGMGGMGMGMGMDKVLNLLKKKVMDTDMVTEVLSLLKKLVMDTDMVMRTGAGMGLHTR